MRAFFDIDTQIDFLYPAGALYGRGGEKLIAPVATLNHFAVRHRFPLISSTCAHSENSAEFAHWPPHCIAGTVGQQKPPALLFANRYTVTHGIMDVQPEGADQILLEKDHLDLFTNPNMPDLLAGLKITECIVYGAFTDYCVKHAVTGLLKAGRKVSLVTDAISALNDREGNEIIRQFALSGGLLTTIGHVIH